MREVECPTGAIGQEIEAYVRNLKLFNDAMHAAKAARDAAECHNAMMGQYYDRILNLLVGDGLIHTLADGTRLLVQRRGDRLNIEFYTVEGKLMAGGEPK